MTAGDEEVPEENEDNADVLPYYHQADIENWGCLGIIWKFSVHFVVTHFALALCLGVIVLGGEACVRQIIFVGWRSVVTVTLDILIAVVYIVVVVAVVAGVSHFGKKITKDEKF